MNKKQIEKLLKGLSVCEESLVTGKTMTREEFGRWIYSCPTGKRVIDTLKENKIDAEVLRKNGFIPAMMGLGWILSK